MYPAMCIDPSKRRPAVAEILMNLIRSDQSSPSAQWQLFRGNNLAFTSISLHKNLTKEDLLSITPGAPYTSKFDLSKIVDTL